MLLSIFDFALLCHGYLQLINHILARFTFLPLSSCQIVTCAQAIEIRLLGLGDDPLLPILETPVNLGAGKVRIEWSPGELDVIHRPVDVAVSTPAVTGPGENPTARDLAATTVSMRQKHHLASQMANDGVSPTAEDDSCGEQEWDEVESTGLRKAPPSDPSADDCFAKSAGGLCSLEDSCAAGMVHAAERQGADRVSGAVKLPRAGLSSGIGEGMPTGQKDAIPEESIGGTAQGVDLTEDQEQQHQQREQQRQIDTTFPVHKYVLQRSCLYSNVASSSSQLSGRNSLQPSESSAGSSAAGSITRGAYAGETGMLAGGLRDAGLGFPNGRGIGGAAGVGDGEWEIVLEAPAGSPTSFVDSGLLPGRTYVYR